VYSPELVENVPEKLSGKGTATQTTMTMRKTTKTMTAFLPAWLGGGAGAEPVDCERLGAGCGVGLGKVGGGAHIGVPSVSAGWIVEGIGVPQREQNAEPTTSRDPQRWQYSGGVPPPVPGVPFIDPDTNSIRGESDLA
jgi:hypothetical protein